MCGNVNMVLYNGRGFIQGKGLNSGRGCLHGKGAYKWMNFYVLVIPKNVLLSLINRKIVRNLSAIISIVGLSRRAYTRME